MILAIALIYFGVLIIGAGIITSRRVKTTNDFTAAESSGGMTWIFVTCTFVLIPLGSGHSMSLWEMAVGGMGSGALLWAVAVGALFLPIMMLFMGPLARNTGYKTFPEITKAMYGRGFSWFHASVSVSSQSGIIAAELIGTGVAIYTLSGGAVPLKPWAVLIAFVFAILYIFFGGFLQMAWINIVNSIMLIVGSFAAVVGTVVWLGKNYMFGDTPGLAGIAAYYEAQGEPGFLSQFSGLGQGTTWLNVIIPVALLHLTALTVSQGHNLPFFAAKSRKDVRKGVYLASAINAMSAVPWVLIGVIAFAIPAIVNTIAPDEVGKLIVPVAALAMLPKPLIGLLMISLLSATLSTAASITLGSAQQMTTNIIKNALKPDMSDKQELFLTKICIFIYATVCLVMALTLPVIMPVFFFCFMLNIPLFFCYITGMFFAINKTWVYITLAVGYIVAFSWTFLDTSWAPYPFNDTTWAVVLVSFICGLLIPALIGGKGDKKSFRKIIKEARSGAVQERLAE
jgi:SSS family solute:Na+ symporter